MSDAEVKTKPVAAEKAAKSSSEKAAKKTKKKRSTPAAHPPCIDMITEAISNLGEKNGSSLQAIKKYITANFDCDLDVKRLMSHVRKALKSGVASGKIVQTKGTGASGSFKMGAEAEMQVSKPTKRQIASAEAKEAKAAKAAKASAKKRPKKKKTVAKKSAKKSGRKGRR